MIRDSETNLLYLADCRPGRFPLFFSDFRRVLADLDVNFQMLTGTKDIWAVDYMPLQIDQETFVQFVYQPDYLEARKWQKTISDGPSIVESLGIEPRKSDIILDGGNVINAGSKVVLCDKILKENPAYRKKQLIEVLTHALEVEEVILVPQQPGDFIGHADGMLRFIDEKTVLVNDLSRERPGYKKAFTDALKDSGLEYITMPYNPYMNKSNLDASGIYLNYLQMEDVILLPVFGMPEED